MARLMADDGPGASSNYATHDRSVLGVRTLIGAGRKSDKAREGDEWKNVFHEHVVLNPPARYGGTGLAQVRFDVLIDRERIADKAMHEAVVVFLGLRSGWVFRMICRLQFVEPPPSHAC